MDANSWLTEDHLKKYTFIKEFVTNKWQNHTAPEYFTPHEDSHCNAVEQKIYQLIPKNGTDKIIEKERFLLLVSVWVHDLGMFPNITSESLTDDIVRERHHGAPRTKHVSVKDLHFLWGESPHRVRSSKPPVPSVA